jgi:hypothetical protein
MSKEAFIVLLGDRGRVERAWGVGGMDGQHALRLCAQHLFYTDREWVKRVVIFTDNGARVYKRSTVEKYLRP